MEVAGIIAGFFLVIGIIAVFQFKRRN